MTYPIVLAHGVCRFDVLWNQLLRIDDSDDRRIDSLHYFKGIRTMLKAKGYQAYHSRVAWGADVNTRGDGLKQNVRRVLDESQAEKVNIIAHSMGGLDARHMLFNDRDQGKIHQRIASLTTISTPHEGTPFADWGLRRLPALPAVFQKIGLDMSGLEDLRTDACRRFGSDPQVVKFEADCDGAIEFRTYAGKQGYWRVFSPLKGAFRVIEAEEGENDGLVSVRSARWRDAYFKGILNGADHLNELGWWNPEQLAGGETPSALRARIHEFYAGIAAQLP